MSLEVLELTPAGAGGVSVLRIAGAEAFERVRAIAHAARGEVRAPQLVRLKIDDDDLDKALVCVLSTSEVELHVHGSPPLVRRIVECLRGEIGARSRSGRAAAPAPAGSGARTVEERAWERLSQARSDSGARILLDQAEGALRRALRSLRSASAGERGAAIEELLERGRIARFALEPVDVVLAGAVNAGKSTLFNLLLGEDRVIVSDEEGTTRDVVTEPARLGAYPIFLSDSAGLRASSASGGGDPFEEGSRRQALRARDKAELVLWLVRADGAGSTAEPEPGHRFESKRGGSRFEIVHTQVDRIDPIAAARWTGAISALRAPEAARSRIREIFHTAFDLPPEPWSAGCAVPLDTELITGLGRLPLDAPSATWDRALEQLLGAE